MAAAPGFGFEDPNDAPPNTNAPAGELGPGRDWDTIFKTADQNAQRMADDLRLIAFYRVAEGRALRCGQ
jgi:hypothetical protein